MSLAAPSPFQLPQELVDYIIDYLHNDFTTLKDISLVSRAWLPTTRLHLFSSVALKARPSRARISQPRELCICLHELLSDNPELARYVRELEIWEGASFSQARYSSWVMNEPTLPPLLTTLSSLTRLQFCGNSSVLYQELPENLRSALHATLALPSLTYLRLHNWVFPTFTDLTVLLSCTVDLKGLALSCTSVWESEDDSESPPEDLTPTPEITTTVNSSSDSTDLESPHTSQLEFLTLDFVEFRKLGYWLLNPKCPLSVRNLRELRVAHSQSVTTTGRLLTSIGGSLEHLHLKPGPWDVHPFDLGLNPCLRTLRLTLEDPSLAIPWVTTLLSSITSYNSLDLLSLEFYADLKKIPLESWSEVDHALTRPELSGLKSVELGVFASPAGAEFQRVESVLSGVREWLGEGLRVYQLGVRSVRRKRTWRPLVVMPMTSVYQGLS